MQGNCDLYPRSNELFYFFKDINIWNFAKDTKSQGKNFVLMLFQLEKYYVNLSTDKLHFIISGLRAWVIASNNLSC